MPALRFTKPIRLKGLSEETVNEWVGLEVELASGASKIFGYLGDPPAFAWSDEFWAYVNNSFSFLNTISKQLENKRMCISKEALIHSCKHSNPPRSNLLAWLEAEEHIQYFIVEGSVAEYLP